MSALTAMAVACSGSGGNGPGDDPLVVRKTPGANGDGQSGVVGALLPGELRVVITRTSEPREGVEVRWATADGGLLDPSSSDTDVDGIATTTWTLGPAARTQTATATVADADGSPVSFTATAEEDDPPEPPPPPASAQIQVLGPSGGNRFEPTQVTIQAGQTVRWIWPSLSLDHNVVPAGGDEPIPSGRPEDGPATHDYTFAAAGTYDFYCANHGGPGRVGMSGTVIVQP